MENPDEISAYFFEGGNGVYVDIVKDVVVSYPCGFLTWRRNGQRIHPSMERVFAFTFDDALNDSRHAFAQELIDFLAKQTPAGEQPMTKRHANEIVGLLYRDIRISCRFRRPYWGYAHSKAHDKLIEFIDAEELRRERNESAAWEQEFMNHSAQASI